MVLVKNCEATEKQCLLHQLWYFLYCILSIISFYYNLRNNKCQLNSKSQRSLIINSFMFSIHSIIFTHSSWQCKIFQLIKDNRFCDSKKLGKKWSHHFEVCAQKYEIGTKEILFHIPPIRQYILMNCHYLNWSMHV